MSHTFADHVTLIQDGQQVLALDVRPALVLDSKLDSEVL
jgi:hypothetical protein